MSIFKAKGECTNCHKKYDIPCKDVKSSNTALKAAGWTIGVQGDETVIACPLDQCQNAIEEWGADQLELPGVNDITPKVKKA